ncbi:MAG TPA: sugar-binding transcriptional regulator [Mycobacteriales bacterium]|nr:sugar-binding transcriptional regulator [Mycobacteriales bacterium]
MPAARDDTDLVKAARLYFQDGLSQHEVAAALGTSRSNVSRMLAAARERGIVQIRICDPAGRDNQLEEQLAERFGLAEVRVATFEPGQPALAKVGQLGSAWLLDTLRDGQTVALSWGLALQQLVWATTTDRPRHVELVQLVGGLSPVAQATTGQELVRELAARLGATYRYLHAPALLQSPAARAALESERSVADALQAARRADIALVGIGAVGVGSSRYVIEALGLTAAEQAEFEAAAPVGDVCARYYNLDGRPVGSPVDDRVLAVSLADLRHVPTVVGLASGREKAPGILGALRGRVVDVLVCDASAARGVLALDRDVSRAAAGRSAQPRERASRKSRGSPG